MTEKTTVTPDELITEARSWLGTAYANQGQTREIGVDCGQFAVVVGRALGLTNLQHLGYGNSPDGKTFERLLETHCKRVKPKTKVRVGDIMAVDYSNGIQHIMFCTKLDPLTVIHAKRPHGAAQRQKGRGVIEHRLLPTMADFRGWVRTYRIPGVE
jgi:hypothetical protein